LLARGDVVTNCVRAKSRGVLSDAAKLTDENETPPDVTSGTSSMVVDVAEQVMLPWMATTLAAVSAGRVVLPMTKQALFARSTSGA
jgi:predicted amidohydrolase